MTSSAVLFMISVTVVAGWLKTDDAWNAEISAITIPSGELPLSWKPQPMTIPQTEHIRLEALFKDYLWTGRWGVWEDDIMRNVFMEGLSSDLSAEDRAKQTRTIYDTYYQDMAKRGVYFADFKQVALEEIGLPAEMGYCPNPKAMGGCTGTDVTEAWMARIEENAFMTEYLWGY